MKKIIALLTLIGIYCAAAPQTKTGLTLIDGVLSNSAHVGTMTINDDEYTSDQVSVAIADAVNQYGAYAYLPTQSVTAVTADVWTNVVGVFSNQYLSGFEFTTNGLTYLNGERDYLIGASVGVQSGTSATYIKYGIAINSTVLEQNPEYKGRYLANAADAGESSFFYYVYLQSNDVVSLVVLADKSQNVTTTKFQPFVIRF